MCYNQYIKLHYYLDVRNNDVLRLVNCTLPEAFFYVRANENIF